MDLSHVKHICFDYLIDLKFEVYVIFVCMFATIIFTQFGIMETNYVKWLDDKIKEEDIVLKGNRYVTNYHCKFGILTSVIELEKLGFIIHHPNLISFDLVE